MSVISWKMQMDLMTLDRVNKELNIRINQDEEVVSEFDDLANY
jgi:hypothetical protein